MFVSPVSHNDHHAHPLAQSPQHPCVDAASPLTAAAHGPGDLDLFAAEKYYRQKSGELEALSKQTGRYEVETLSDSDIKSLRAAGVPIDAFLKQHGEKLGWREYGQLAELILKTRDRQAVASLDGAAFPQPAATATVAARAYV